MPFDVVVVGAGIVGCACAAEFADAGLSVALVESHGAGSGATAAAMGHIAVMADSEAQFALTRYGQLLWKNLASRLPAGAGYRECGAIWVASDEAEMTEVHRQYEYYSARKTPVEVLDCAALTGAEPNLRRGLAGGLLLSDDAVLDPVCAARFLAGEAQRLGGRQFFGRTVLGVQENSVTMNDGNALEAEYIVVASGIHVALLIPGTAIQPRKGHLLLTAPYPGFIRHQVVELGYLKSAHAIHMDSVAFNVQPRPGGEVLIGSSRQYGTEDLAVEESVTTFMLQRAIAYMPGLAKLSLVRGWTGFRAATSDKLPLIGAAPGYRSVYLATGHEGLGVTTSLATAKLLADAICGRQSAIPIDPYLAGRARR